MQEFSKLSKIQWKYLIVDEGQKLKVCLKFPVKLLRILIPKSGPPLANILLGIYLLHKWLPRRKIILTGTPLQNNMSELWSLLNFLEPEKFPKLSDFLGEFGSLNSSDQVARLHKKLAPFLLRYIYNLCNPSSRTKEIVELTIPQKEETLIELDLTNEQKKYYRAAFEKNRDFLNRFAPKASLNNVMMQVGVGK